MCGKSVEKFVRPSCTFVRYNLQLTRWITKILPPSLKKNRKIIIHSDCCELFSFTLDINSEWLFLEAIWPTFRDIQQPRHCTIKPSTGTVRISRRTQVHCHCTCSQSKAVLLKFVNKPSIGTAASFNQTFQHNKSTVFWSTTLDSNND